jgi:hypothetical protein
MGSNEAGIRGGNPGSAPVWGDYIYMALPNWAGNFFIDALLSLPCRGCASTANAPSRRRRGTPVLPMQPELEAVLQAKLTAELEEEFVRKPNRAFQNLPSLSEA